MSHTLGLWETMPLTNYFEQKSRSQWSHNNLLSIINSAWNDYTRKYESREIWNQYRLFRKYEANIDYSGNMKPISIIHVFGLFVLKL